MLNKSKATLKEDDVKNEEVMSHHPQMIDEDVETFTNRLDTLILTFRTDSLKEFMRIKRNVLAEQIQKIESEKARCTALLTTKQDELEHTKDNLVVASIQAKKSGAQVEKLSKYLKNYNKKSTVKLYKALIGLREALRRKKRNKRIVEMRLVQHNRVVKLTVFGGLKRSYGVYKRKKNKEQEEQRVKVSSLVKYRMKYQRLVKSMRKR
jgi:hypothetical protein